MLARPHALAALAGGAQRSVRRGRSPGSPTEVELDPADGMPRRCAVNLDHVQTVSRAKLGAVVATLRPDKMLAVRSALAFALAM